MYLVLLVTLFVCIQGFTPEKLSFDALGLQRNTDKDRVLESLESVGFISVNHIPGFSSLRKNMLQASASCLVNSKEDSFILDLSDESKRYTLGFETENEVEVGSNLESLSEHCNDFNALQREFRDLVSDVTLKFADFLDNALELSSSTNRLLLDTETGETQGTITSVVKAGTHLEHFHLYEKKTTIKDLYKTDFARELHTDQGLFIVLAPAMSLNPEAGPDHGFFVQLPNGEIVQPDFGADRAELVVMIGDGYSQWISPNTKRSFRATPHAVVMPYSSSGVTKRSWYGRMILPKPSVHLQPQGITFGELRSLMTSMSHIDSERARVSACSHGLVLNERLLQISCPEGTLFCWLSCEPLEGFGCTEDEREVCGFQDGDQFVECDDTETHSTNCQQLCFPKEVDVVPGSSVRGSDFCNGFGVSMYMDGFTGIKSRRQGCIVFLFEEFKLDSSAKYFLASVITVLIGITTEFIVSVRRRTARRDDRISSVLLVVLYALQVTFGYIAMLIAMTYSIVLFVMIILGLTIGHRLFNIKVVPKEFNDPCCAEPVEAKPTERTL